MTKNRKTYNFSISDPDGNQKIFSFNANSAKLAAIIAGAFLLLVLMAWLLVSYTPLRHTVKGYPSVATREAALQNRLTIDSLERQMSLWAYELSNIQRIITGREPIDLDSIATNSSDEELSEAYRALFASRDSLLRGTIEKETAFDMASGKGKVEQIEGLHYFTPVKGMVTEGFSAAHQWLDIAAEENTTIYSILDGTVISADWNDLTGYVITVQHSNNLISVYKHNDKLLKKAGDRIKVGTPIAVVGSTGSLSSGTALHFELWHDGKAVDPALYINF